MRSPARASIDLRRRRSSTLLTKAITCARSGRCIGSCAFRSAGPRAAQSARASPVHQARAGGHGAEPDLVRDITKLLGPTKWTYFYTSCSTSSAATRFAGWSDRENSALAGRLIEETCHKQGVQPQVLTLHSDRGAPMTSKCTVQLLADLGVTRSLSTLRCPTTTAFSDAQFDPEVPLGFPGRFHDITAAIAFCRTLRMMATTPNIAMAGRVLTPDDVHRQSNPGVLEQRGRTLRSRLESSRTLRSRDPTTGSPPQAGWIKPPVTFAQQENDCSVNRNGLSNSHGDSNRSDALDHRPRC